MSGHSSASVSVNGDEGKAGLWSIGRRPKASGGRTVTQGLGDECAGDGGRDDRPDRRRPADHQRLHRPVRGDDRRGSPPSRGERLASLHAPGPSSRSIAWPSSTSTPRPRRRGPPPGPPPRSTGPMSATAATSSRSARGPSPSTPSCSRRSSKANRSTSPSWRWPPPTIAPEPTSGKLSSDADDLTIRCHRLPKVIQSVRDWSPEVYLVGFKLLSNAPEAELIRQAREACRVEPGRPDRRQRPVHGPGRPPHDPPRPPRPADRDLRPGRLDRRAAGRPGLRLGGGPAVGEPRPGLRLRPSRIRGLTGLRKRGPSPRRGTLLRGASGLVYHLSPIPIMLRIQRFPSAILEIHRSSLPQASPPVPLSTGVS